MTDASSSAKKPVFLGKGSSGTGKNTGSAALAPRPPAAMYAAYAMAGAALFGAIASVTLYFQDSYVYRSALKTLRSNNDKAKASAKKSDSSLIKSAHDQVAATHKSALIGAIVVLLALGFIGYGIWRGRHWARWGTLIIWFLCSFTATSVGIGSILGVGSDVPVAYKIPSFLGAALMVVAVVLTSFPSAVRWFALSKPTPPAGARPRGGLFGPRPAPRPAPPVMTKSADNRSTAADRAADGRAAATIAADRARAKKRAGTASVAKGADLARTRAKAASKSRRTDG